MSNIKPVMSDGIGLCSEACPRYSSRGDQLGACDGGEVCLPWVRERLTPRAITDDPATWPPRGEWFLAFVDTHYEHYTLDVVDGEEYWLDCDECCLPERPTHWLPMPEPPVTR